MFFAGVYGFISRRSLLMVLISVELILNAADINFAAFNRYLYPENLEGFFFAMFTIAISACETAVAIAIVINIYRNLGNVEVESIETIQEPENNPQNLQL
jgi:NADH-quinone oxidoreductase subunit K